MQVISLSMDTVLNAADINSAAFFKLLKNPVKFRLFLLQKLPAAYFSGVRLKEAGVQSSTVTVPFKWFTKNPFRSTYFACLSMAAEMSTGILAMAHIYKRSPKVSMLVVSVEGKFYKKAVGVTRFVCDDGLLIRDTVGKAVDLFESQAVKAKSSGYNENGELVAEFWITWSFKSKAGS
jgi:hypothetical protein